MSRPLQSANLAASTSDWGFGKVFFVELDFAGGTVYANSSAQPYTIDGILYPGVGRLGQIGGISEAVDDRSASVQLALSGVDNANILLATGATFQNRRAVISVGFTDSNHDLVATPDIIWAGYMDTMPVEFGDAVGTIELTLTDPRAAWDRPRIRRYTDADQQASWPGDTFFTYVTGLQDRVVTWGPPGSG